MNTPAEKDLTNRFNLEFDPHTYRRIIGKKDVVIHCHHYNARLQNIIEGTKQINGKLIILSAAEEIFSDYIHSFIEPEDILADKWQIAAKLYAHLGYGHLDFSKLDQGIVTSSSSHFVEGWKAGFIESTCPVCTFTQGYLQGVIHGITGQSVYVREKACMNMGADVCQFIVDKSRTNSITYPPKRTLNFQPKPTSQFAESNIDEEKIINALVEMPFYGNNQGLIPAFNVYLANTPADFYNLICIRFMESMKKQGLFNTAKNLLLFAGEVCAVNTIRGIIISAEWYDLIAPMVQEESDNLYGLIAVTNGLGWGNWHVINYESGETLQMEALNGYEALGYLEYKGAATEPQCFTLTGVAAGIMALLHGEGTVEERVGTYASEESHCICCQQSSCKFQVELL
ncbi:V4R domain-containing protein [Coleofasciculus sp.]|uniref:V4R domain-containing protein n=1 Tax=Coleofasciculus sp. TaxID=3100458 RepID=UPI003A246C61